MNRRMPNADHVCVGHIISIFFTMRTFYMSVYDVLPLRIVLKISYINLFFFSFLKESTITKTVMDKEFE